MEPDLMAAYGCDDGHSGLLAALDFGNERVGNF